MSTSWTLLSCCLVASALSASAQNRKPGLWEVTSTQSSSSTSTVCLTQQLIDKYGAPLPQLAGCKLKSFDKKGNSITGEMACSGTMVGKLLLESTTTDPEHAKGKIHFIGTLQDGANTRPIEWTITSTSVFKASSCGNVKPFPMPEK